MKVRNAKKTTYNHKKIFPGFTLAEILIVLLIIGVIFAMTLPTLMTKIQDREFKTAAKKAYSETTSALKKMEYDNGTTNQDYLSTARTLKPAIAGYFKILKDCNFDDCTYPLKS